MLRHRRFVVLVICLFFLLMGNSAPPWYACEGKADGDPCQYGYGCSTNGVCRLNPNCTDEPNSKVNECLTCVTGRAATQP